MSKQKYKGANIRQDLTEIVNENYGFEENFNADKYCPDVVVTQPDGKIPLMKVGNLDKNSTLSLKRGEDGAYSVGTFALSDFSYETTTVGFQMEKDLVEDIPLEEIMNLEETFTEADKLAIKIGVEKDCAAGVFNTGFFAGAANVQAAGASWLLAGTDVRATVDAAALKLQTKAKVRKKLATLMISSEIYDALWSNTDIKSQVVYTDPVAKMTEEAKKNYLKLYFGVKDVMVLDTLVDSKGFEIESEFTNVYDPNLGMLAYLGEPNRRRWTPGLARKPRYLKATRGKDMLMEDFTTEEKDRYAIRIKYNYGLNVFLKYGVLLTGLKP